MVGIAYANEPDKARAQTPRSSGYCGSTWPRARARPDSARTTRLPLTTAAPRQVTARRSANCPDVMTGISRSANTSPARASTSASITSDLFLPAIAPRSRAECREPSAALRRALTGCVRLLTYRLARDCPESVRWPSTPPGAHKDIRTLRPTQPAEHVPTQPTSLPPRASGREHWTATAA